MRLLSRKDGKLHLTDRTDEKYAILSHRWLAAKEEVLYADVLNGSLNKSGAQKIDFCLSQAERDGYEYVWIDSCCINRDSSTELSTALNSMFRWYAESAVCYVYLADVNHADRGDLTKSQWFTRGWTLQELIAPADVRFYSSDRYHLGDRSNLHDQISRAARFGPMTASPQERFSWSLGRQTTEPEDMSYCMLGIMGVTLNSLYGITAEEAQRKLFRKIEKKYGRDVLEEIAAMVGSTGREIKAGFKAQPLDDTKALLNSLKYDGMNLRWEGIETPFPETCRWLLDNQQYKLWLDGSTSNASGSRMLWIKGKPGSGKSTIMKFADTQAEGIPKISFYFNARGAELEHSVEGMYRSLLYQLVQRDDGACVAIASRRRLLKEHTGRSAWSLSSLKNAFTDGVKCLNQPLRCFIDALDEGEDDEVQDMVHFLEDLSREAQLYVCFASRYYPSIVIASPELHLTEQLDHEHDLRNYIIGRLHTKDTALIEQVTMKANGVFMWAMLVVRELNKVTASGSEYKAVEVLDSMPGELLDLLDKIVSQGEEQTRFEVCMHWILYNDDTLSPESFCTAVVSQLEDAEAKCMSIQATLCGPGVKYWGPESHTAQWISTWSRGLGEVVGNRVRPIHESVRDYLLHDAGESGLLRPACRQDDDPHDSIIQGIMSALQIIERTSRIRGLFPRRWLTRVLVEDCLHLAERFATLSVRTRLIKQLVTSGPLSDPESGKPRGSVQEPFSIYSFAILAPDELVQFLLERSYVLLFSTATQLGLRLSKELQSKAKRDLTRVMLGSFDAHMNQVAFKAMFEALVAAGMDMNATIDGRLPVVTLLHLAPIMPTYKVQLLSCCGPSPDARMDNGWTPLHTAVIFHGLILNDNNADFVKDAKLTETVFTLRECACKLARGASYNIDNLLHNVDAIARSGVNVNEADKSGRTPLMLAVWLGQTGLYEKLIDVGASVEATDHEGFTVLDLLYATGQLPRAEALLQRQARLKGSNR